MSDEWKMDVYSEGVVLTLLDVAVIVFQFDGVGDRWISDVRLMAAAPQLLSALSGLYEHTQNNRNIAGLNQAALEAIEAAVGRAPEGDAREEDENE